MNFLPELLTVAGIHLLACMSPGPDFLLVSQASLVGTRKNGIFTALGIALGLPVHIGYCLLGIGLLISQSILLFSAIKLLGAGYLIYLGVNSFRSKHVQVDTMENATLKQKNPRQAFLAGLLTNILNPKVSLFFLALFTQVISPETPLWVQLIYAMEMVTVTFVWFALVATVLSVPNFKNKFLKASHIIDRVFGGLLIALGIKIAVSSR